MLGFSPISTAPISALPATPQGSGNASNAMTLTETLSPAGSTWKRPVSSAMALTQSAVSGFARFKSASNSMALISSVVQQRVIHFSHALGLSQMVARDYLESITHQLNLAQAVTEMDDKGAASALVLNSAMSMSGTWKRPLAHSLGLTHSVAGWVSNRTSSCDQFAGLGTRDHFTLTWPFVSPSLTLDLRNPKFGNKDRSSFGTEVIRTMSQELRTTRPTTWPTVEVLSFEFEALSQSQRDGFVNFVESSASDEVGLLDQENRQWRGVIISPTTRLTQAGRGTCYFTAQFDFQGRLA